MGVSEMRGHPPLSTSSVFTPAHTDPGVSQIREPRCGVQSSPRSSGVLALSGLYGLPCRAVSCVVQSRKICFKLWVQKM